MPLIKLNNAGKHYLNKQFNLEINRSDFILVSGENGNGKTTLIQLILGFTHPDTGCVESSKIKIGYLPEKAMLPLFIKVLTYLETLAKIKKAKIDQNLLLAFNIPLFKSIHELSKGNQQKLAILSTFLGNPDLIILDEPLSGLDTESTLVLKSFIEQKKAEGMSFMISTHQPEMFIHMASTHLKL
ncbi:ATP-binding cassette domain-containing protein [Peloplasma aerotolerans]|uniref:ATP-binding cassette domain-containing protein n=1 Tax=Peloplasma aerotolerans TaxID=3044389 RepID=A0AAW6U5Y1_9MOLU|nr:ATP-binding cassette domain-containing protein [Mariniplasma sp. M4Ah]MDI6451979.1 ATP-binding cassette domain-containing protein [Mariniplasma sp. M4Ah]MDR4968787.1 ATP-binding cassette domain-containing protein [Acholeplasmataceae bacterium]